MKKQLLKLMCGVFAITGIAYTANCQELLKDLEAGNNVSSGPHQFTNVDGTVYFFTDPGISRRHALWKTDGTAPGTVMVQDSIISTSVSDRLMMRGVSHDSLFYTVNTNVQTDTTTELWLVKNGTAPVLVTTLVSNMVNQFSNGEPRKFAMAGGKLFFQMYTEHGYELWVCDGTAAGTHEVADLFPGSTSGIANGGTADGKVYFQGLTSYLSGENGLYMSDGSAITLLKSAVNFNAKSFSVFNGELYFGAAGGLWKTDGTTAGTVNVTSTGFNGDIVIFKNNMYYNVGNTMYKSDGTTAGTAVFNDTIGTIHGMNSNYFFSRQYRSITTPPYIAYDYWRSDGTAAGTERIVDSLGKAASFVVINNKMYSVGLGDGLWETDGTATGVKTLLKGVTSYPIAVNNKVVFSNFGTGTGYEPWVYAPSGLPTGIAETVTKNSLISVYPNPSNGIFQLNIDKVSEKGMLQIYNATGEMVYQQPAQQSTNVDITGMAKGIYFIRLTEGTTCYNSKIILQ